MSNNLIQPALSSGELSPSLFARVDLERYQTGVALMRNFFVDYRGGATTRPGTRLVGRCLSDSTAVRHIRFSFNTDQNYVLEFSNLAVRIIKNGEYILSTTVRTITAITQDVAGARVTSNAHGFTDNQQVFITGVLGMTEVNNQTFIVASATANTFRLKWLNGTLVDSSAFAAYTSGGTATQPLTVTTTYVAADLFNLRFTQSGDVMTITHPSYAPRELTRLAEDNWTISTISFASTIAAPTGLALTPSSSGKTKYSYVVTAVNVKDEESVASTAGTHSLAINIGAAAGSIGLDWNNVTGAVRYNVYKANPINARNINFPVGVTYGFIGDTTTSDFVDTNIIPDFTRTPPRQLNPFSSNKHPACVAYYQQRIVYGGADATPEQINMSQTGQFKNFDESLPVKDDDAVEATVASLEINRIRHMLAMPGGLLVLTSGSAFQINGGGPDAPVTPDSVNAIPQSYNGCGNVPPIPVDVNVLYIQQQGSAIRSLAFNFYTGSYTPKDVSIFSNHLVSGYEIADWTYAEEPNRIIWAARDDGRMVSLTYLPEQKIEGMALHSTQGIIESICAVQEGNENATYLVVKRLINGTWIRFSERMMERNYEYGTEDAWNLDCAIERALTTPSGTLTASAKTGSGVTFTASGTPFTSSVFIGRIIRMGGGIATITGWTSTSVVTGTFTRDIDQLIPETDTPLVAETDEWSVSTQVTTLSGLWHLNGMTVSALADGVVREGLVVTNGTVTLPVAASKIIVGLPYTCILKTLPIDTGSLPTIQGKRKNITALTVRLHNAKGIKVGSTEDTVVPANIPSYEDQYELYTGDIWTQMDPNWQEQGVYYVIQDQPLPASVLGFIPELTLGDTAKP